MDTFRLNPDAVRRSLPNRPTEAQEPDEADRLAERVREVGERVEPPAGSQDD
ncbi:MAG TPA: hypothetical protein VF533_09945 [Solirubrobacteraceae bacterium]|jgi:hypothetical protein